MSGVDIPNWNWVICSPYIIEPSFFLGQTPAWVIEERIAAFLVSALFPLEWLLANSIISNTIKPWPAKSLFLYCFPAGFQYGHLLPSRHWPPAGLEMPSVRSPRLLGLCRQQFLFSQKVLRSPGIKKYPKPLNRIQPDLYAPESFPMLRNILLYFKWLLIFDSN